MYQDIAIDTESKTTRFTSVDNCKNLDTLSTENIDRSIKNHEVIFDFKYLSKQINTSTPVILESAETGKWWSNCKFQELRWTDHISTSIPNILESMHKIEQVEHPIDCYTSSPWETCLVSVSP